MAMRSEDHLFAGFDELPWEERTRHLDYLGSIGFFAALDGQAPVTCVQERSRDRHATVEVPVEPMADLVESDPEGCYRGCDAELLAHAEAGK